MFIYKFYDFTYIITPQIPQMPIEITNNEAKTITRIMKNSPIPLCEGGDTIIAPIVDPLCGPPFIITVALFKTILE